MKPERQRKSSPGGVVGSLLLMSAIIAGSIAVIYYAQNQTQPPPQWSYSQLLAQANAHHVRSVSINGQQGVATDTAGRTYDVTLPDSTSGLASQLASEGVNVQYQSSGGLGAALASWLPNLLLFALMGALIWWLWRRTQGRGAGQATSFGRSNARLIEGERSTVRFRDVAGVEEAKQELTEVVEFLRSPLKFQRLGARIPKGVLMFGPPGSGKTLLAKAIAGEAGVPFFSISGSEFVEMFVGVGASRVRDLFEKAKQASPCLIFVDEIDAVGRQRGTGLGGGSDEREQTLNQLLVEMDGFETDTHVIVMAATNRPDVLDPALLRPGRFDRHITLDRPDVRGRREILEVHTRDKPLASEVDLGVVAQQTPGFCGSDLANLVNEAAILAARGGRETMGTADLEEATARVLAGPERKSMHISDEEKRIVAYHESGHALVMKALPHCDRVRRVSIISRGSALGWTLGLPDEDHRLIAQDTVQEQLAGMMGGRAAEELIFHRITSGAANDIQKATSLTRRMITQWGMSERIGPVTMGESQEMVFLGRDLGERRNYSEEMAALVDEEVHRVMDEAYATARQVLIQRLPVLHRLAEVLVAHETIEEEELDRIVEASPPVPVSVVNADEPAPARGRDERRARLVAPPVEDCQPAGMDASGGGAPRGSSVAGGRAT